MKFAENVDNFLHATIQPVALYTLVLIQNTDNVHQLPPVSSDTGCCNNSSAVSVYDFDTN